jgi:hypothetical protein
MKKIVFLLLMSFSTLLYGQTGYEKTSVNQVDNSLKILSSSDEEIVLELSIGNYLKRSVKIDGNTYYSVNLVGESWIKEKGNPELPKITRSIMIPSNSGFVPELISKKHIDIELPVTPSKGILPRTINPDDVPYSFSDIYSKDAFFPESNYSIGEPYLIRDARGIAINFYPFTYNPVKKILRVYTSLTLKISFEGTNLKNASIRSFSEPNKYFEPIIKRHFINYVPTTGDLKSTRTVDENGSMLIICHNDFMDEMQDFVTHKNNRGLSTELVSMNTVGSTANDVDTYIQNEYDSDNSLTFVLLVGDNAQIPTLTVSGGGSDPSFSLVAGSDNYPDIIIGRFSAENGSQVETMVERSIDYENMSEQNWFHNGTGIASSQGTGDDGEYDYEHIRNIRTDLLAWHYNQIDEFYDGSQGGNDASGNPTPAMISSSINSGVSIINYTGHGSTTSWSTSGFSNTNVNALTNDDMLPFIFSVACVNGNFTGSTCFAESWLRATNSSTNRPTGAIGFYGSSINQSWSPPMQAQDEFNNLLINEDYITFGALCYNASFSMIDDYGSGGETMFLTWHIFGDPSIEVIPNNNSCTITNVSGVITTDNTYTDCKIEVINTTIQNNANVIFDADESTTINGPFEVKIGSTLEVK